MKKFSIGLVCALFFGAVFGGTGTLVYHCTFDSVAAVENPEVGPSGTCWYSVFVQGIEGNALNVSDFIGDLSQPLKLFFPVPQVTRYPGDSRVPFLIDEFKVWNSDVTTVLTISTLREVALSAEGEGTVKGAGTYLANARVTLSAKAAKGFTFLGWYKGEERMSRDASYAYLVGADEKQTLVAKFVTVEEDRASLAAALAETALDAAEALVVTNYQGVAVSLPLACDALTKPTVSVSDLPSGYIREVPIDFTVNEVGQVEGIGVSE